MYGLVNNAVQGLIVERFGEETWARIKKRAAVEVDEFLSMASYPDDLTYRLVGAATEELSMPAEDILHAFGEYWVLQIASKRYGDLMTAGGRTLPEFLQNLDQLHSRVRLSFPDLQPPSFRCSDIEEGCLTLHYISHRPGLAPFVTGLIQGLAKLFEVEATVTLIASREEGAEHDQFRITYAPLVGT